MTVDTILQGDAASVLRTFPPESVDCCITSPPYYALRRYGVAGEIGQDQTVDEYIASLVEVFDNVKRVLKPTGTLWIVIGDTYCGTRSKGEYRDPKYHGRNGQARSLNAHVSGCKGKDLIGIPWRLAFALRDQGWYLRQDIVWHKPNAMPESVKDRCTRSHEYIFMLTKEAKYYYDNEAIKEPCVNGDPHSPRGSRGTDTPNSGRRYKQDLVNRRYTGFNERYFNKPRLEKRNKRDVWSVTTHAYRGAHFATFPKQIVEPCILAGCPKDGIVLDCFSGAGTTAIVAKQNGRHYIGIELNPDYITMSIERIEKEVAHGTV